MSTDVHESGTPTPDPGPLTGTGKKMGLAHRLYTGDLSYEFMGRRRLWYTVSAILLGISILALLIRGLNLGIEFKGGVDLTAPTTVTSSTVSTVHDAVLGSGVSDLDDTTVLTVGSDQVKVQTRSLDAQEVSTVRAAIAKAAGTTEDKVAYNLIGPSWGTQVTWKAVQALVVFIVLVMLLIWIYFRDWKMSVAAITALFHDLILTIGIYALVGFAVTPATLIGVLTILGYSLYDTVVVFDKVRENVGEMKVRHQSYSEAANVAVNQVLVRSINTTIIGVLPVIAILVTGVVFLGSGPLEDLGLALFVGMVSGAYSSIFIATPLLAQLKEREPAMIERRHAAERYRAKEAAKARLAEEVEVVPVARIEGHAEDAVISAPVAGEAERRQRRHTTRSKRKH